MNRTVKKVLLIATTIIVLNLLVNLTAYFITKSMNADGKCGIDVRVRTLFGRGK